jgi:chemotaxis protein CheX
MDLEFLEAEIASSRFIGEEINAIIGVSGNLKRGVIYGLGNSSALAIPGQMMGEPVEEVDEICRSILGELANMSTGNAVTGFPSDGYSFNFAPRLIIEHSYRSQ